MGLFEFQEGVTPTMTWTEVDYDEADMEIEEFVGV